MNEFSEASPARTALSSKQRLLAAAGAFGLALTFFGTPYLSLSPSASALLGIAILLSSMLPTILRDSKIEEAQHLAFATFGFLAIIIWLPSFGSSWHFLPAPQSIRWLIALSLFAYVFLRAASLGSVAVGALLLLSGICCFGVALENFSSPNIWTDDHSTFMYRLSLLKDEFPNVPFYSPNWNGGYDARDFLPSGIINAFLLLSPILYFSQSVEQAYPLCVVLIVLVFPFISCYAASRVLGLSHLAGIAAGALSISLGIEQFRWALGFGTLGFLTSASLMPLVGALGMRYLQSGGVVSLRYCAAVVLLSSLALLWTPTGIALVPLGVLALITIRTLLRSRSFLPVTLLLILVNLPWVTLFWSASNVGTFLQESDQRKVISRSMDPLTGRNAKGVSKTPAFSELTEDLQNRFKSSNPLLLVLFIPGVFLLRGAWLKAGFTSLAVWLVFLSSFAGYLIPKLELERLHVFLSLLMCVPAGLAFERIIAAGRERKRLFASSILLAFTLIGLTHSLRSLNNQGPVRFTRQGDLARGVEEAIKKYHTDGRVLFSGFVLHELNGGHLAPLPMLTGVPLVASSYIHNLWQYHQVVPEEYLEKGPDGYEEFFSLMNATLVFAHERPWREYFRSRPDRYTEIWSFAPFTLFKRDVASDFTLAGSISELEQRQNHISFRAGSKDIIVKFNYFPFLKVDGSSGCVLEGHKLGETLEFISLSSCKVGELVEIRSKGPVGRVLG